MRAIAVVADLLFQAKIRSAASAAGVDAAFPRSSDAIEEALAAGEDSVLVLVDLTTRWVDALRVIERIKSRSDRESVIVAFGFHDDPERLQAAREAGADRAMPRSVFVKELGSFFA